MKTGTYNIWGTLMYIDKDTWSFFQKKQWDKDFKEFTKETMAEFISYYKWEKQIYQPFTALLYRAYMNWKLSKFKGFLIANQ